MKDCFNFNVNMFYKKKKNTYMPKIVKVDLIYIKEKNNKRKNKLIDNLNIDLSNYC